MKVDALMTITRVWVGQFGRPEETQHELLLEGDVTFDGKEYSITGASAHCPCSQCERFHWGLLDSSQEYEAECLLLDEYEKAQAQLRAEVDGTMREVTRSIGSYIADEEAASTLVEALQAFLEIQRAAKSERPLKERLLSLVRPANG